jgi:hypothetical protein
MATAGEIHRCHILDVFKVEQGRVTRDAETKRWRELLHPVLVDVRTGIVQMGDAGTPVRWGILQRGEAGWDFVASRAGPDDSIVSTLRLRMWETPMQMVVAINGFTFATGICEPLHRDSPALMSVEA